MNTPLPWFIFNVFVVVMLVIDLGVFHRRSHEVKIKEALLWTGVWVTLALLFNAGVWLTLGKVKALEFLTAYLLEKALSVDNIFVFILIFTAFGVLPKYQHKVLFWGILGALFMRAAFILLGVALLNKFHWLVFVFGILLVWSGFKIAQGKDKKIDPEKNWVARIFHRYFPVTDAEDSKGKFYVWRGNKLFLTHLAMVLVIVETTDLIFAIDSIPAVLAISNDPFIIYTSNVFAILGLRALYFALSGVMKLFHYLHFGLALILVFVGVKMMTSHFYHVPVVVALGFIVLILTASVAASLMWPKKERAEHHGGH